MAGLNFNFDNSYSRLPANFYAKIKPTAVSSPNIIFFNKSLASSLGLDFETVSQAQLAKIFSGNEAAAGAENLAMAYAGHQFGHFVPQLGDGRAILLGEIIDPTGKRHDLQLKGAGRTPYSRNGDGRAALGPVIRELIVSEAMHALGVPTTRALAAVSTGEMVLRESAQPGAILARVGASHIRIGTFQYFAARGDQTAIRALADYATHRHYPEFVEVEPPYLGLLERVIDAQAQLVATWMQIGFIHGVMNTDNMTISGETIDFGPCAFMDQFESAKVYSSIDRNGRYAFSNQPDIALWNLTRLAESLLPLLGLDQATATSEAEKLLQSFSSRYEAYWLSGLRQKLGLTIEEPGDLKLAQDFFVYLEQVGGDFTNSFRELSSLLSETRETSKPHILASSAGGAKWLEHWSLRIDREPRSKDDCQKSMLRANPAYIPRNHLIERAIRAAVDQNDFSKMSELMSVLSEPYRLREGLEPFQLPPNPNEIVHKTFCGT